MIRFGFCNELFDGWPLRDVCRLLKGIGYEGVEVAPFTLADRITDLTAADLRGVRDAIVDEGLAAIGFHWLLARTEGFSITSSDPSVRVATADYLARLAEASRAIGGSLMVLGSPKQRSLPEGVSADEGFQYADDVLRRVIPHLEAFEVDLCLEPLSAAETNFLNTCDEAERWIDRLGSPRLKLHMDVKAQSSEPGASVPELIRRHAGSAGHFHAQDPNLLGPGMGEVDFGPILRALVDAEYDRWVSVEAFDATPGAEVVARQSFDCLRANLAKALSEPAGPRTLAGEL